MDGEREASREHFRTAIDLTRQQWRAAPGDLVLLGNLIEYTGMLGDAAAVRNLIAVADSLGAEDGELLYQIGDAYELIGDRNAALRHLAEAVSAGIAIERVEHTRELQDLVADPRFASIVAARAAPPGTDAAAGK